MQLHTAIKLRSGAATKQTRSEAFYGLVRPIRQKKKIGNPKENIVSERKTLEFISRTKPNRAEP